MILDEKDEKLINVYDFADENRKEIINDLTWDLLYHYDVYANIYAQEVFSFIIKVGVGWVDGDSYTEVNGIIAYIQDEFIFNINLDKDISFDAMVIYESLLKYSRKEDPDFTVEEIKNVIKIVKDNFNVDNKYVFDIFKDLYLQCILLLTPKCVYTVADSGFKKMEKFEGSLKKSLDDYFDKIQLDDLEDIMDSKKLYEVLINRLNNEFEKRHGHL